MQEVLVPEFDYASFDSETRIVVQQRTSEIRSLMGQSAGIIREIGQKLIEVKSRLGHGYFGNWLYREFQWSHSTANNYMLVAEKFPTVGNLETIAPSALYLLASDSTPEEVREEFVDRAASGEKITKKEVQSALQKLQAGDRREVVEPAHPLHGQTVTVQAIKGDVAYCATDEGVKPIARGWLSGEAQEQVAEARSVTPKPQLSTLLEGTETALDIARKRIELLQEHGSQSQAWIIEVCDEFELPEPFQTRAAALRESAIALGLID